MKVDLQAVMDEFWQNRAEAAEAENERMRKALRILAGHLPGHDGCRYARRVAQECLDTLGETREPGA